MRTPDLVFRYLGHSERIRQRALKPHTIVVAPLEDPIGCSAVNRRVASSNRTRGAILPISFHSFTKKSITTHFWCNWVQLRVLGRKFIADFQDPRAILSIPTPESRQTGKLLRQPNFTKATENGKLNLIDALSDRAFCLEQAMR